MIYNCQWGSDMALDPKLEAAKARAEIFAAYGSLLTPVIVAAVGFWFSYTFDNAKKAEEAAAQTRSQQEQAAVNLHENQRQCLDTNLQLINASHSSVGEADRATRDSDVAT